MLPGSEPCAARLAKRPVVTSSRASDLLSASGPTAVKVRGLGSGGEASLASRAGRSSTQSLQQPPPSTLHPPPETGPVRPPPCLKNATAVRREGDTCVTKEVRLADAQGIVAVPTVRLIRWAILHPSSLAP